MNRYLAAAMAMLLAAQPLALAGIGDIDPAYGDGGRIAFSEDNDLGGTNSLLPLPDGRALLPLGSGYGRVDAAGRSDSSFGNQGRQAWPGDFRPNWDAWLRLADGSTLLGGEIFTAMSLDVARSSPAVVRLDASGQMDPAFAGNGMLLVPPTTMAAGRIMGLALQGDGRLLAIVHEFNYLNFYGGWEIESGWNVLVRRFDLSLAKDPGFGALGATLVYATGTLAGGMEQVAGLPTGVNGQKLTVLKDGLVRITNDPYDGISPIPAVHLRYLNANGLPVVQPLPDPALDAAIRDWQIVSRLPDGSVLMDGFVARGAGIHYRLFRLRPDGRPDTAFGNAGSLTLDDNQGGAATRSHVSADGRFLYLGRESGNAVSVTRVLLHGTAPGRIDDSFGEQGVMRIAAPLVLKALQGVADGSVLVVTEHRGSRERLTFRLLPTASPSPGIVSFDRVVTMYVSQPGHYRLRVSRSGGSSGAVSLNLGTAGATMPPPANSKTAAAGHDYLPVDGKLTWADGETGEKSVILTILPAFVALPPRSLEIQLDNVVGATWIPVPRFSVYGTVYPVYSTLSGAAPDSPYIWPVAESPAGGSAAGAATSPGGATSSPGSNANTAATAGLAGNRGGGGAIDLITLLALCSIAGACVAGRWKRNCVRAPAVSRIAILVLLPICLPLKALATPIDGLSLVYHATFDDGTANPVVDTLGLGAMQPGDSGEAGAMPTWVFEDSGVTMGITRPVDATGVVSAGMFVTPVSFGPGTILGLRATFAAPLGPHLPGTIWAVTSGARTGDVNDLAAETRANATLQSRGGVARVNILGASAVPVPEDLPQGVYDALYSPDAATTFALELLVDRDAGSGYEALYLGGDLAFSRNFTFAAFGPDFGPTITAIGPSIAISSGPGYTASVRLLDYQVFSVPEPSKSALLIAGLLLLPLVRKQRSNRRTSIRI